MIQVPFSELPLTSKFRLSLDSMTLVKIYEEQATSGGFSCDEVCAVKNDTLVFVEEHSLSETNIKPVTKIKWNYIEKVGMPDKSLRFRIQGGSCTERTFLIKGEYSVFTGVCHTSGPGFNSDSNDIAVAWAIIEGF